MPPTDWPTDAQPDLPGLSPGGDGPDGEAACERAARRPPSRHRWWAVDPEVPGTKAPLGQLAEALPRWQSFRSHAVSDWESRTGETWAPRALAQMIALFRFRIRNPGQRHAAWWIAGGMPPGVREKQMPGLAELVVRSMAPEDQTVEGAAAAILEVCSLVADEAWLRDEWLPQAREPGGWLAASGLPETAEDVQRRGRPKKVLEDGPVIRPRKGRKARQQA